MSNVSPGLQEILDRFRTEAQYRAAHGCALPRACPWCGSDPGLARKVNSIFLVGCDADECAANPQVSGKTLEEAWAKWNGRL